MMADEALLPIGVVLRAHGVRGGVRVRMHDPASEALAGVERVRVGGAERVVERASRDKAEWLVKLAGVDDRDAAEALRGLAVEVRRADLPRLDDGEFYLADLVGYAVV